MAIMLANGRWRLAVVAGLVVVRQAGELIFAPFFAQFFFSRTFYYYLILSDYPCSEACTGGRHVTFCTYILHKFLGSKQSCALMVRLVKLEWVCRLQQLLVSAVCGTSQKTKWIQ